MNGAGPGRWATLLYRGEGRDPHRVSQLRLEWVDRGHEDRVISYGACEAANPLLACFKAGFPERSQRLSGLGAETKGSSGPGRIVLREQGRW